MGNVVTAQYLAAHIEAIRLVSLLAIQCVTSQLENRENSR